MELMATLVLAHLLADFPLQSNAIAAAKAKSLYGLLIHVMVHVLVLWTLLGFCKTAWALILGIGIAHFIVDWVKKQNPYLCGVRGFLIDQFAHFLCIVVIAVIATTQSNLQLSLILPTTLLNIVTILGFSLPAIVLYWIWINTLQEKKSQSALWLHWNNNQLLQIEQSAGLGLILILGIGALLYR